MQKVDKNSKGITCDRILHNIKPLGYGYADDVTLTQSRSKTPIGDTRYFVGAKRRT